MTLAAFLLLCLPLAAAINAPRTLRGQQHRGDMRREDGEEYRPLPFNQSLTNHGDMQYTGKITVGGQSMEAIIDTGSFELLVFSTRCHMCGKLSGLFSEDKSDTYTVGNLVTEHSFGSGSTESTEAYEKVEIGNLTSKHQVFWEVIGAAMPVLSEASFQAILGVGPPQSAVDMAIEDEEAAQQIYTGHASVENRKDVEHYAEVVDHAKNVTSLAANLGLKTFSFCLERGAGNPGWFIWYDIPPRERPVDMFSTLQVVGDLYWSAELTDVRLGVTQDTLETGGVALGCQDEVCSAVLDSGTSLISAPASVVDLIEDVLAKRPVPDGDCTDLKGLPDLEFSIGGHSFSLPPQAYVGEIEDVLSTDLAALMPHLQNKERRQGCVPVLMTLDADSQFGPLWVLGMPFFRKYYSTFHLEGGKDPRPAAQIMSFAKHDGRCRPKEPSLLRSIEPEVDHSPMRINLAKLHAPRWVHSAKKAGKIHL